jgi:hypothetical protein
MNIITIAKKAALDAMNASNPVAISFGKVINIDPLRIEVNQRMVLPKEVLVVPESLTRHEVDLKHVHSYSDDGSQKTTGEALPDKIIIRSGLQVGDKVLLLRVQGGQQYIVFDKVVGP